MAVVKTHLPYSAFHPLAAQSSSAVLLVRHPRDVLLSCMSLHRALGGGLPRSLETDADYAHAFLLARGDPVWASGPYGSWDAHWRSWRFFCPKPVLLVRYEELRNSPVREFRRIVEHVHGEADDQRVDLAVRQCTIERLRAMEDAEKQPGAPRSAVFAGSAANFKAGARFINSGGSAASLDRVAPGLDARLRAVFDRELQELGYDR